MLSLLGRRIEALPMLLVVTYRDEEIDRAHPLRQLLGELRGTGTIRRLTAEPLSLDAVAALAARTASTRPRCTAPPPATRSSSPRCWPRAARMPATVRDAVLARAARLGRGRRRRCWKPSPSACRRPNCGCSTRSSPDAADALEQCLRLRHARGRAGRRGVPARARPASRSRSRCRPHRRRGAAPRRAGALATPPSGAADLARLAHHAEAAGDADGRPAVRAGGGRAGRGDRRAPRGGRAVRARAAVRRRPAAGGGRRCWRGGRTSATSPNRRTTRSTRCRRPSSAGGPPATGCGEGRRCRSCPAGCGAAGGATRPPGPARRRCGCWNGCRRAANWRWRTAISRRSPSTTSGSTRPSGGRTGARARRGGRRPGGHRRTASTTSARCGCCRATGRPGPARAQPGRWPSADGLEEHVGRAYIHLGWAMTRTRAYELAPWLDRGFVGVCGTGAGGLEAVRPGLPGAGPPRPRPVGRGAPPTPRRCCGPRRRCRCWGFSG